MEPNYGTEILSMSSIAPLKKRALRIIYPVLQYDEALDESKLKSVL